MAILSAKWGFQSSLFILFFAPLLWGATPEENLQEAQKSYQQGLYATVYQERKEAFNQALSLYHSLQKENPYSADLNQSLGDIYFQLNDYPLAILYYQKALRQDNTHSVLSSHLAEAQKKLGLKSDDGKSHQIIQWLSPFSLHFNIFYVMILLTFLSGSYFIWHPHPFARKCTISCSILLSLLMTDSIFHNYFTPLEGVLIKSTGFYREPDWNQSQIRDEPLLAGSKVQILEITKDHNWLKISEKGVIGFIPMDHLRPI